MQNFQFAFDQPLWFLLLIPALALTVVPYFMLSKKYRRTRNRIVSMILHILLFCLIAAAYPAKSRPRKWAGNPDRGRKPVR